MPVLILHYHERSRLKEVFIASNNARSTQAVTDIPSNFACEYTRVNR